MVFSRLRQSRSWSSRNSPDELAQLRDKFPIEKPEKLDQALKDTNGNYLQAVQSLNSTHIQTSSGLIEQHTPNKLKKPEQGQYINPYLNVGFSAANTHPKNQLIPSMLAAGTISILAPLLHNISPLLHLSHHIHSMQTLRSNTLPLRTSGRSLSPPSYRS